MQVMGALKLLKPHQILTKALKRKQERLPRFSQRALARDLGVSAAFLSKVLTGQRMPPPERLSELSRILELDSTRRRLLYRSFMVYSMPTDELRQLAAQDSVLRQSRISGTDLVGPKKFALLQDWQNIAVLTFLGTSEETTVSNISKRLDLPEANVAKILRGLEAHGMAHEVAGAWKKITVHEYFPSARPQAEVRDFHKQMLKKAFDQLNQHDTRSFEERLITSVTIAVNPDQLESARNIIFETLSELAERLSEGHCTETYQCNVQLFPLTKRKALR